MTVESNLQKEIVTQISEDQLFLKIDKGIYEREAVLSSANKYTDRCTVLVEPLEENSVGIYFEKNSDEIDLEKIAKSFCNELLDQQVRLDLEKRYGNLRELIYKKAFAPIKNLN